VTDLSQFTITDLTAELRRRGCAVAVFSEADVNDPTTWTDDLIEALENEMVLRGNDLICDHGLAEYE